MTEQLRGKQVGVLPRDTDLPDEGEQAKRIHAPNGIWPPGFLIAGVNVDDKGVVEMRNGDDVPGVTGHGARADTAWIVDKIINDHLDNFKGKPGGRRWACRRGP